MTNETEKLPPPKKPLPLWIFAVHPKVAQGQPNWRTNLISDFDITPHSVGTFDQFTGRCKLGVAKAVSRSGRCAVMQASDEEST